MDDQAAAKEHIKRLRHGRHFNDSKGPKGDANAHSLSRALDMLSAQLYSKPTHFILEMIQNADDNIYADNVEPTLRLIYRDDGYLFVGCNEVGFTEENVSAICEIADSTKKSTGSKKGYIGEKGIGFKSVFKVADMVWVSSGAYTFKFNRDDLLGMIVPIWNRFKGTSLIDERTMFCLQIPDRKDRASVRGNLLSLGPELLLFLRKLRHIRVQVVSANQKKIHHEYILRRQDSSSDKACTLTTLTRRVVEPGLNLAQEKFAVFRHTASKMPEESKREGITESEIIMAFPTSKEVATSRTTFNFLPIRDYGLPFLLQADFILTASRQDIVERNLWNESLMDEAHQLFVQSVKFFNKSQISNEFNALRYGWPRFTIPIHVSTGTPMEGFLKKLRVHLREEVVLQSQLGSFESPKSLMMVPEKYCDDDGQPLFDNPDDLSSYVDSNYVADQVVMLGVNVQLPKDFVEHLSSMPARELHRKPEPWHSKLAGALLNVETKLLQQIELIPVRGGKWVSPQETSVYFPPDKEKIDIPSGIECHVLAEKAAGDWARKRLYQRLGVKKITSLEVCNLILKRHTLLDKDDPFMTPDYLVAHAWYLFVADRKEGLESLKFAVQDASGTLSAKDLYMDAPGHGFQMTRFFPKSSSVCSFIHPKYLSYGDSNSRAKWYRWLEASAGVATLPRLSTSSDGKSGITPIFQHLIDAQPSTVWLTLLRDHWDHYSPPTLQHLNLGKQLVDCTNGHRKELRHAYLARESICGDELATKLVDFVVVGDPEDEGWDRLRTLGLSTEPDLRLCISVLRTASKCGSVSVLSRDYIQNVFHAIERHSWQDPQVVLNVFQQEALVPARCGDITRWLRLSECRWSAPACLSHCTALDQHFRSSLKHFFCDTLKIPNASIFDTVEELCQQADDMNNLDNIRILLLSLSEYLGDGSVPDQQVRACLKKLQGGVFPVQRSTGEFRLASNSAKDVWFIGDRSRLLNCFRGKVWILNFDDNDCKRLGPLFKKSGLGKRFLSNNVEEKTEHAGGERLLKSLTAQLQATAKYVSLLASEENKKIIHQNMKKVTVHAAKDVKLRRHISVGGTTVHGIDESGRVVFQQTGSAIRFLVPESSVAKNEYSWAFISAHLIELVEADRSMDAVMLAILTTGCHEEIRDILERENLWKEEYVPETIPQQDDDDDEEVAKSSAAPARTEPKQDSKNTNQGTKMSDSGVKKEARDASTSMAPAGKNRRAKEPVSDDYRGSKKGSTRSSSYGTRRSSGKAAAGPDPDDSLEAPDAPEGPDDDEFDDEDEAAESDDSNLIESIILAAGNFEIDTANFVAAASADDETQVDALDLLQPSFVVSKSGINTNYKQFQGELFLFQILRGNFDAPESCWTSPHRTRFGLPDIDEEDECTTAITISDPQTVQQLVNHFINNKVERANDWLGEFITFHIDVKVIPGDRDEPFAFTNEQVEMARQWQDSSSDVHIIAAIYGLPEQLDLCIYIEPLKLVLGGDLEIVAVGGYSLKRKWSEVDT